MTDDYELIERWRQGDKVAGNEFFERYYQPLRRFFAAKLRDEDEREDLIQVTFEALLTAIHGFARRSSARTFVLSIARNKLIDHLRERYRKNGNFDSLRDSLVDLLGRSPSSHAAMRQQNQQLLAAIAQLPVDDQILIELNYWHDLTSPELAELFGITAEAVRARLFRARQKLAESLSSTSTAELADQSPEAERFEARLRELGREID